MSIHAPSLAIARDAGVAARPDGYFDWTVHRGPATVAFLTTSLAGLGAGEELEVEVALDRGAQLALTAQGPTALLATDRAAVQRWRLALAEDSHLTHLPWATLPYPRSRGVLDVEVLASPGATFCAWELLATGRAGLGEQLELAELSARWRIQVGSRLVLDDRIRIDGAAPEATAAAFGGHSHLGSLYLLGYDEDRLPLEQADGALGRLALCGLSRPDPELLVVRALDRSAERLERGLWPLVELARTLAGAGPLQPSQVGRRWL